MKPTLHIDPAVLDNAHLFKDPFYGRLTLKEAEAPLALTETIAKRYLFPTFYGDVTCAMGIFLCDYAKAERMMLHPRIRPVRMPRGRAIVAFSCYTYNQVLGVPPYNEIAMTIPVLVDSKVSVPVLPMLVPGFPRFGYYVFSMPVTSLENQIRGRKLWGLPKVVEEIELRDAGADCVVIAKESTGETYFTLRVPKTGKRTHFDVRSDLYSRLDDRLLRSETRFKAEFAVQKHPRVLVTKNAVPPEPYLTLGATSSGQVLRELSIEPEPLETRYAEHMTSAFALPDPAFVSPIAF
jgi:hypothetical protein